MSKSGFGSQRQIFLPSRARPIARAALDAAERVHRTADRQFVKPFALKIRPLVDSPVLTHRLTADLFFPQVFGK
jgi:hypothetical protein